MRAEMPGDHHVRVTCPIQTTSSFPTPGFRLSRTLPAAPDLRSHQSPNPGPCACSLCNGLLLRSSAVYRDNASSHLQVVYAPGKRKDRLIPHFRSVGYLHYSTFLVLWSPGPLPLPLLTLSSPWQHPPSTTTHYPRQADQSNEIAFS
jgi:hypothetical protein